MKKTYTKKQITEAIAYWEKQLKKLNESSSEIDVGMSMAFKLLVDAHKVAAFRGGSTEGAVYMCYMNREEAQQNMLKNFETFRQELGRLGYTVVSKIDKSKINGPCDPFSPNHGVCVTLRHMSDMLQMPSKEQWNQNYKAAEDFAAKHGLSLSDPEYWGVINTEIPSSKQKLSKNSSSSEKDVSEQPNGDRFGGDRNGSFSKPYPKYKLIPRAARRLGADYAYVKDWYAPHLHDLESDYCTVFPASTGDKPPSYYKLENREYTVRGFELIGYASEDLDESKSKKDNSMEKKYTKKQITEAIAYWEKKLNMLYSK